jgi:precorrin-3B synthase
VTQLGAIVGSFDAARRGACPTLHEPMQTGDGLLARLRVTRRMLAPRQLLEIARLAQIHGNGLVEITARGNLQVRGLRPDTAKIFAEAASQIIDVESGLVIGLSPLAGNDPQERANPRALAGRIGEAAKAFAERLGPKVSVVLDGAGQVSMHRLKADIRLVAQNGEHWAITLGGSKPQIVDEDAAVATTIAVLGALAAIGPDARATDLFTGPVSRDEDADPTPSWRARMALRQGHCRAVALPFGQIESTALVALCDSAETAGLSTLRLAPDHTLLVDHAPDHFIEGAARLGFITDPDDPRRRVSACIGNKGCASGLIAARQIAARLAPNVPPGQHLHVSGCTKGCAYPRSADVTLVGRADGIGLVINGRAGDTPRKLLDEAALFAGTGPFQDGQ